MFSRMCVCIIVLVYIITVAETQDDSSVLTSPVLQRPRPNYLTYGGKTYYFGTIFKTNFYGALQFCRQQGMQLVSITSQSENERLGRFVGEIGHQYSHFWTSGANLADEKQWVWLSTGNNMVYTFWRPGEPSGINPRNLTENCVQVLNFGPGFTWNDVQCDYLLYFICESSDECRK